MSVESGSYLEEDIARRKKFAESLMLMGMDTSPVKHPLAAVARALQGGYGGWLQGQDRQEAKAGRELLLNAPGMQPSAPVGSSPIPPVSVTPSAPDREYVENEISPLDPTSMGRGSVPAKVAALLQTTRQDESGNNYGRTYGGGSVSSFADHPRKAFPITSGPNMGRTTSAAGADQFLAPTWDEATKATGVPDFSPLSQDKNASWLAQRDYQARTGQPLTAALDQAQGDPNKLQQIGKMLSGTWTSLPGGIEQGKNAGSFGQRLAGNLSPAGDQPPMPPQQVAQTLNQLELPLNAAPAQAQIPPQAPSMKLAQVPQPGATTTIPDNMSIGGKDVPSIPPQIQDYIRKLMSNPYTAKQGAALYQQYAAPDKSTDEIKEYKLDAEQLRATGRPVPNFGEWKANLKRAGAIQNTVQIDQKGETEFSKEAGKLTAKRFNDLADDAPAAKQTISDVNTLRTLGAQIGTGKGAQVLATLGPYAQSLGIDVKGLDEAQAYDAIVNRVAPTLRVKGSGAQSDMELRNFLKSLPSLGNTPGGNELIAKTMEGMASNKLAAAEIASKALHGELTRSEADKQIRALPDHMSDYRDFVKKNPPSDGWTDMGNGVRIREKK